MSHVFFNINIYFICKNLYTHLTKFNLSEFVFTFIKNKFNKYIIICVFNSNICWYINFFKFSLKKSESISLIERIDFSLDLLILRIYYDIKNINVWILFFICSFYLFFDCNSICANCYMILFFFCTLILLIKVYRKLLEHIELKHDFPLLYYIIKCFLLGLIILNLGFLVITGQKAWNLLQIYLRNNLILKINSLLDKLKDLKLNYEYQRFKGPKKPNYNSIFSFSDRKKKKNEVEILKKKILKIQSTFKDRNLKSKETFCNKRNWKETIEITNVPNFSPSHQLINVEKEIKDYAIKYKKFKSIVINIEKGKEKFFPYESKELFNDYINLIKLLKDNLKDIKKNLKKN